MTDSAATAPTSSIALYRVYNSGEIPSLAHGWRSVVALPPGRRWITLIDWTTLETARIEIAAWEQLEPQPDSRINRRKVRGIIRPPEIRSANTGDSRSHPFAEGRYAVTAVLPDSGCLPSKTPNNLHIMEHERTSPRRFTRSDPCPVCGGYDGLVRGKSIRCFGYYDHSRAYARCTREERAGGLPQNRDGTYSHRLHGSCRCGQVHGDASPADYARPKGAHSQRRQQRQRFRSYFTLSASLRKRYGEGASVTPWVYEDANGHEALRVLRIDYSAPDGSKAKSYRPCHKADDGRWRLSAPPGLLPLYRLPAILAAPPEAIVAVLEGEKCADIAAALRLPCATTSAHGAQAPQMTDWSPLAGRSVAILRDEGEKGAQYAAKVAELLAALDPPADVRIVSLPGLADAEDIEQFAAARRSSGCSDAEIQGELLALIDAARISGHSAAIA